MFKEVKLVELVKRAEIGKIQKLADKGKLAKLNEVYDKAGYSAVTQAALLGEVDILSILLTSIDVNHKDKLGRTALYVAALTNQPEVAKVTIDKKVDYNLPCTDKMQTAIDACLELHSTDVLKVIGDGLGKNLLNAAKKGDLEYVRELVQIPMLNLEASDTTGWTALHYAVKENNEHMVEVLAAAGAVGTYKNMAGNTPLDLARSNGNLSIVKLYEETFNGNGRLERKERDREVEPEKQIGLLKEKGEMDKPLSHSATKFKHKKVTQQEIVEMELNSLNQQRRKSLSLSLSRVSRHKHNNNNNNNNDDEHPPQRKEKKSKGSESERSLRSSGFFPSLTRRKSTGTPSDIYFPPPSIEVKGGWKHRDESDDLTDIIK